MFKELDKATLRKLIEECDAYSIVDPGAFASHCGLPKDFLRPLAEVQKSGEGKYMIARNDGTVGDLWGVHLLDVLTNIADEFGITEYRRFMGRGSAAREIQETMARLLQEPALA